MPALRSAPAAVNLRYYGGRVVSNLQVVQVLWGGGSYLPNVSSTTSPSMATFFQGVLDSAYVDWLSEYSTVGLTGGSNQTIGRGSFAGQYAITPSTAATIVDDSQIQAELAAQIGTKHLPAPTTDAAGNSNSYYAVFFPHGVTITLAGTASCAAGGFCAYHNTIADIGGQEVYYGVQPDMQAGSGCDTGCGTGSPFDVATVTAAHELVETITDPEVGLGPATIGPPLAWYDATYGEVADICDVTASQQGTIVGGDGVTYAVQQAWSNLAQDCIVSTATTTTSSSATPATSSTTTTLPHVACTSDAECADGDPCTIDTCAGSGCRHDEQPGAQGVTCRLAEMDTALMTAPASVVRSKRLARGLHTRLTRLRTLVSTAHGKHAGAKYHRASVGLRVFLGIVERASGSRIAAGLAAELASDGGMAEQDLARLPLAKQLLPYIEQSVTAAQGFVYAWGPMRRGEFRE